MYLLLIITIAQEESSSETDSHSLLKKSCCTEIGLIVRAQVKQIIMLSLKNHALLKSD